MGNHWRLSVLACLLISLLVPAFASASTNSCGDLYAYRVSGDPGGTIQQGYGLAYDNFASGSLLAARGARGLGNVQGGVAAADDALRGAQKWLGEGYKEIAPGVFRSDDGLRQFRMTASDLTDPKLGPHVHFEAIAPDGRTIIENSHVLLPPTP